MPGLWQRHKVGSGCRATDCQDLLADGLVDDLVHVALLLDARALGQLLEDVHVRMREGLRKHGRGVRSRGRARQPWRESKKYGVGST